MNELDFYNPYDEDDLMLVENKPRKRRRRKTPEPIITVATPLLLLIAGYLGWCVYAQSKTKVWSWQPWKTVVVGRRLQLRQANNAQAEEERRQAEFDRAIEQALKPSVVTIDTEVPWRPVYGDTEKERVSFIEP